MANEIQPDTELQSAANDASQEGLQEPEIQPVNFNPLSATERGAERNSLDLILDVQLGATVELGRSQLAIRDVLALGPGSVVELDKLAGEPADLLINGKPLARGEVVVIDENFGIRITEIMTPTERIHTLR
jgi:flagellar motor switch protein FliN/FliY